jgi:general secretion pathway protein I
MKTDSRANGFTLVEVMVALAIVAVALPALMFSMHQQIDGTAYLRDKSFARMVASNRLNEIRLISLARQQLEKGTDTGSSELAGREWLWRVTTTETVVPNFYRIQIDVSEPDAEDGEVLFTLIGSLSGDLENMGVPAPGKQSGSQYTQESDNSGGSPALGDLNIPNLLPGSGVPGEA